MGYGVSKKLILIDLCYNQTKGVLFKNAQVFKRLRSNP
ncbi:Hypothetical protein HPV225_1322 [Helicobacter pylori v225d]|nr:Hypothetical protein HPV225_1322 [Helicobacter pylori v225d]